MSKKLKNCFYSKYNYIKNSNLQKKIKHVIDEKKAYDYAQKSFAQNLQNVNVFDDNTQKSLQSQLDAYAKKGQTLIDNLYTPVLNNLKTDIASRFGNFDNSVFMDKLNNIESNRADSMNSLAQDILNRQDELINNELSKRYTYLNFLQDLQNRTNSTMLSLVSSSQQNSASGNNYNSQAYAANLASGGSSLGSFANLGSN